ncbi:MAG: RHS repeat-associated core domain-containing protein [Gammaproteobacteria bacterium]|nr:MAG: RHS repeat-associated core domain-containing protein [Gammaproteobacteria bacterium]
MSFGAYGERRDSDWDGAVSSADMTAIGNTTRRGFTGHEHLDSVSLIHMNGRVYEPVIGRMLSPDAVVQIGSAQSVNCYAYVWNNPLTRTDPSGWVALDAADSWRQFFEWIAKLQRDHAEWEAAVERSYRREQARLRRPGPPERRQRPGGADGEGQPQSQAPEPTWLGTLGPCASDQLGISDLAALGAVAAGQPIPGTKPFVTPGSSRGTSLAGMVADEIFDDMKFPVRVPTIVGGPGTGRPLAIAGTRSVARFAARAVPVVGWAVLAYDAVSIGVCTFSREY